MEPLGAGRSRAGRSALTRPAAHPKFVPLCPRRVYFHSVRGALTTFAVLFGLLVGGAGPAAATSYCVGLPDTCAPADNRASLEAALSSASASPGADQVLLGPGTFTSAFNSGFDYGTADPVEIVGRGASLTTLTVPGSLTAGEAVLSLSGHADSAVRDVAVAIPATAGAADGIALSAGRASGVSVGGTSSGQVRRGIALTGGLVEHSAVVMPGTASGSVGVASIDGTIDDVEVRGTASGTGLTLAGATSTKRLLSVGHATAISVSGPGTHAISQSVLRNATAYGIYSSGVTAGQTQSVNVSDTTINACGTYGVLTNNVTSAAVTFTLRGMNIVNQSYGIYRGDTATVTSAYSNVWNNSSGNYSGVSPGTGSISQPPQFVSATDLRLQATSPLIDAGDPAAAAATGDAGGRTRDVDGNNDATVRRDIGAHEYQRAAPVVTASATPAQPQPGEEVTFSSTASDPDADQIVIGWTFSDGTVASTPTVKKTWDAPGTYTGTMMVTDQSGRSSSAQASVTIPAPPVEEKPVDPAPPSAGETPPAAETPPPDSGQPAAPSPGAPVARDSLAPKLSTVSLSATLRLGKAAPAPAPNGNLRFTLSEAATVRITFSRARGSGRATRFVKVPGAITVAGRGGLNRIRFAGRLSRAKALKLGRYRMTLTPTDAAGNTGTPVTRTFTLRAA